MRPTTICRAHPCSRSAHPGMARRPAANRRLAASEHRIPDHQACCAKDTRVQA